MLTVKIVTYGNVKSIIDFKAITEWKSKLFTVIPDIEEYIVNSKSDTFRWEYSDKNLLENLPSLEKIKANSKESDINFVMYVTNIPLECNYFSRILSLNQFIISTHEIKKILDQAEVPLENFIIAMLYVYSLMFISSSGKLSMDYEWELAHNDSRGCIFNQCGNKEEIIETCVQPHLCETCKSHFLTRQVSADQIKSINVELKRLNRPLFYRIKHFIKNKPILTLLISALFAICINIISSLLIKLIGI